MPWPRLSVITRFLFLEIQFFTNIFSNGSIIPCLYVIELCNLGFSDACFLPRAYFKSSIILITPDLVSSCDGHITAFLGAISIIVYVILYFHNKGCSYGQRLFRALSMHFVNFFNVNKDVRFFLIKTGKYRIIILIIRWSGQKNCPSSP